MDNKCFKWAVTAALHHEKIKSHLEHLSNIRKYVDNYDWSGLKFPVAINKVGEFKQNNYISINILGVEEKIYIWRKTKHNDRRNVVNLLLIADGEHRHYTMIKSLSRLLRSSNSKHEHKQHFCLNCLQGFHSEKSRDNHFEYCKDNETVRIKIPKRGSLPEVS